MSVADWTLSNVATVGGWLVAALVLTWSLSRRSHGWDKSERAWEAVFGAEKGTPEEKAGAIRRIETLESAVSRLVRVTRGFQEGLDAHGSSDQVVAAKTRQSVMDAAHEVVERNRQAIIAEAEARVASSASGSRELYVEVDAAPPHPALRRRPTSSPDETSPGRYRGKNK